jgi:uncharacterized protein
MHDCIYLPAAAVRPACWPNYELPHAACVEYANAFRRMAHMKRMWPTVLACALQATALAQQPPVSSIRVTGDARVTAKPDRVQINIGVTTRAAQSQDAAAQNARQVDTMLAAVRKAAGPTAVLKTISYSLNPNYQYHPNGGEPTLEGYTAVNVVQVTLDELGKIGAVIDAATQAGANHVQGIQFTLRDQDAVRAQALREAALRARAEADVLAAALGRESRCYRRRHAQRGSGPSAALV